MKKLAVAYVRVDALTPYAKNARTHSEAQIGQLAQSIRKFGWTNPILVDGVKGIIAGHGRLAAAKALGMTEVPVIELAGLTAAEKRAYILADNKLALNAGWDEALLTEELRALGAEAFDLSLTGFEPDDIAARLAEDTAAANAAAAKAKLSERFGLPPFSVLNAREGWWQDRKRAWLDLGIRSELGRGGDLIPNGGGRQSQQRYATPGGSMMPAADYSKNRARGDGRGRKVV